MKMPVNRFKAALRNREKQIGLWVSLAHPYAAEIVAAAGYDWLCVDTEHAPGDMLTTLTQLQAIAPHTSAIVRPPWNDAVIVKRLLDAGAPGLLFPMVQTVAEAQAAIAATRYPPNGVRGVAGSMRGNLFGRITDYYQRVEQETCTILQIETAAAIAIATEIGTLPGCDGIFFGPADISMDMGYLAQPLHPKVWETIMPAARKLIDAGVPVGTLVTDPGFAAQLLNDGFDFVAVGTDAGLLAKSSDALLAQVRSAVKG